MLINYKSKGVVFDFPDQRDSEDPILVNARLALKIAGLYAKVAPRYKDDLLSVAFLRLVKVIRESETIEESTLVKKISSACASFLAKENFQIGSRKTFYNKKGAIPKLQPIETDLACVSSNMTDLKDFLLALANDPLEEMIINLRIQGLTDQEIADSSGTLSLPWIWQLRKQLEGRYKIAERRLNAET